MPLRVLPIIEITAKEFNYSHFTVLGKCHKMVYNESNCDLEEHGK